MSPPPNPLHESDASQDAANARQDTVLLSEAPDSSPAIADTPSIPVQSAPSIASSAAHVAPFALQFESPNLAPLTQRYDILAEAGHGNMGNVYKALDRETGETVALKLLKPGIASDAAMMERFKNELLFARKITHKNVCRVYDFNRIGGIAYTSMEFVEGESLRSVLNRFGGFPLRKGVNVALQICSGLKEAHAQGIVHRDLKPENVMIDAQGNVKIMDFGIARSMEAATRLTGSMVGTPAYMAPEQVSGKPVDYRTDIYSLGLMLYEIFTGTQAVQADTPVAVALKQIRETPPHPHDVDPTIPLPIERAILKCLEKDPAKRYQSVAELEKALPTPGVTGSSPGLGPFITTPVTPANASAAQPVLLAATVAKARRTSLFVWIVLGAVLVVAGLTAAHWFQVVRNAAQIPALPALPAPSPPDFALTIPTQEQNATPAATPAESSAVVLSESKAAAKKPPKPKSQPSEELNRPPSPESAARASVKSPDPGIFPPRVLPGKKSMRQMELEKVPGDEKASHDERVPNDVELRAERAFSTTKSAGNDKKVLLWVGRFPRQDKAQEALKKIRGLGLPALSFPRYAAGGGQFWIVVTGPFPAERVSDVTQWLESQGYRNVHPLESQEGKQPPKAKPGSVPE